MIASDVTIKRRTTTWSWALLQRHWVKINDEYMLKRLKIVQTPWFAVLLTKIYKPDSERYPHSHFRSAVSLILSGGYTERVFSDPADLSKFIVRSNRRWSLHTIPTSIAHSITRVEKPLWTLLLAGPTTGEFVFWTPDGKIDYTEYGKESSAKTEYEATFASGAPWARDWHCYMGRFRVPEWLFAVSPKWMHKLADKFGGVE
jgi:hypothetical protein